MITDCTFSIALFATAMFHNLGVDWAGSLLGFLAVAFMPIPFLFYIYGEKLRRHSRYAPKNVGQIKRDEENQESPEREKEEHEE